MSSKIDAGAVIGIRTGGSDEAYFQPKGVLNTGYFFNITNLSTSKTIKYINVYYDLYNGVGDKLKSNVKYSAIGPIKSYHSGMYDTEYILSYGNYAAMDIFRVSIQYMDGSTKTVSGNDLKRSELHEFSSYETPMELLRYRSGS